MPSTRHISKPGSGHTPAGMLVILLVLSVAITFALPTAKAYAEGTTLGILVTDSKNGQTAGKDGTTKLGIRVTNSKKPIDITYVITLDLNGAPGTNPEVTVTYNLPLPKVTPPSWTGYTFVGYFDAANTKYYNSTGDGLRVWDKTAKEPLYAHWDANKYKVTLNQNGGNGGSELVMATFGSAMPAITLPAKTGYNFQGYFDAPANGNQYYRANGTSAANWDKATNDATLYAYWSAKTTSITLDRDGGNGGVTSTTATYGSAMQQVTVPSKDGYTFAGYFDDKDKQYYDANGKSVTGVTWDKDVTNATLKAHWTLQISCSFPSSALVQVDASGAIMAHNDLPFLSSTVEPIKVTAVKSTKDENATSLFANTDTLNGTRIVLTPPSGFQSVEVPLTTTGATIPGGGWTIPAMQNSTPSTFLVAFSLSLPKGAQLNYLAGDGTASIANLSYVVSAASAS